MAASSTGRRKSNSNTSTSVLSRAEKVFVQSLTVHPKPPSQHGNSKSVCWRYFGQLCDSVGKVLDEDRVFCKLCLQAQQDLGDKGHLSQVISFAKTTSSGNMNLHLNGKHEIVTNSEEKTTKILGYLKKFGGEQSPENCATSTHEMTRDILVWFCRDLLPFDLIERAGLVDFFKKNFPHLDLPSPDTLGGTALEDVYQAVRSALQLKLKGVKSICLMFDGWTDRYKTRPYMGVRISFLDNWKFTVVTLGCHVLPVHTSRAIADHVSKLLKDYFPDPKKLFITSCHDGAANMVKTSKLLKVDNYQHCTAHSLHLLLTTDSINKQEEVCDILQKCRNIVTALHFKTPLMQDEFAATKDQTLVDELMKVQSGIASIISLLDVEDQYSLAIPIAPEDATADQSAHGSATSVHQSLKASCPTRWNSTLFMIESIVQLKRETNNALKRSGHLDLCLHEDEIDFLKELIEFLAPFKEFTDIFGCTTPTLSMIPMMKLKIKKICLSTGNDDPKIQAIKSAVISNLDKRLPITEHLKLNQLLDPDTKDFMPRHEATKILEDALQNAIERNFIILDTHGTPQLSANDGNVSSPSAAAGHDEEEPAAKKRRLRQELVDEFRCGMPGAQDSKVAVEVASYLTSQVHLGDADLLEFWKKNSAVGIYPLMCQLAQLHLSSSSSSVPVECMFSTTGLIANSKRSSLSAEKLHRITFIHDNFDIIVPDLN